MIDKKNFIKLFEGNSKTFGQWNPLKGKSFTKEGLPEKVHWDRHLDGDFGIGRVPILDDDTCVWGAIDIDSHREDDAISVEDIAKNVYIKGLPITVCRSKSGGVHCYVFAKERVPASLMRMMLKRWAEEIGYGGSEIFPKQVNLRDNQLGNWINLPYFNHDDTVRYAVEIIENRPVKLNLHEFIQNANSKKLTLDTFRSFAIAGNEQAPPCIQGMMMEGVPKGYRNEAMYAFTIYFRKKFDGVNYKDAILEINKDVFDRPLPISEALRTIKSAARREYKYRCVEEPCRSLCDSKTCLEREFGIEPSDSTGEGVPSFTDLKTINTDPPMWEVSVNGVPIIVQTSKLRNYLLLAEEIMERLFIITPILNQKDWMKILSKLIENVEYIDAPDNASIAGSMREKLAEFLTRADLNSNGMNPNDMELLTRGLPVVRALGDSGKRVIAFRGGDFVTFLKRVRSEELKGNALWMAIRKMGVSYKRMRVGGGKILNVWYIPIDGKGRTMLEPGYDPDSVFVHSDPNKVVKILNKLNF